MATSTEDRFNAALYKVASTTERFGIPATTFAAGAVTLIISTRSNIVSLPWLGTTLILASLATYIWLTSRSTVRVQLPPPPIPVELKEQLDWMRRQLTSQDVWMKTQLDRIRSGASE